MSYPLPHPNLSGVSDRGVERGSPVYHYVLRPGQLILNLLPWDSALIFLASLTYWRFVSRRTSELLD